MVTASPSTRRGRAARSGILVLAIAIATVTAIVPTALAAMSLGDYYDTFSSQGYSGSAGSLPWTGSWEETNDDGAPETGLMKVTGDGACPSGACLVIGKAAVPGVVAKLRRTADLSAASTATLSFTYKRHKHGAGSGLVKLQVGDGHKASTLQTFALDVSDNSAMFVEYDITPWISSTTTLRFKVSNSDDDSHMNVDNVRIELFAEENIAPELDFIADATITEESPFSFVATASDANVRDDDLAFSLDGAPSGATMSAGGVFAWTPSEAQGPGVYPFEVTVTDDGLPSLSDSQTVTLTVTETNAPPVLAAISDKSIAEGGLLTFTATATDPDTASTALRFSLTGGPPTGASITPGGTFAWTPDESQGPDIYTFGVTVTDDGLPDGFQSDTRTITVTVTETNRAPTVAAIYNKTINEGTRLSFTASATDPDLPANDLTFNLAGAPPGASITSAGSFEWTPTEAQGPGTYTFSVIATDNGIPARSDAESVTITVAEANIAPTIDPIGIKSVGEGNLLQFTVSAFDMDVPADSFEFTLAGAPAGAAITPSGLFTWRPTEIQGPGTYHFDVVATDDGVPPKSRHADVTVVVTETNTRPVLAAIPDESVVEGARLIRNWIATDGDSPANTLHFSLNGAPVGATVTPTGRFEWTPNEAQGPGTYTFDVVVTDDGSPAMTDSQTLTIRVAEGNNAPVIDPIGPFATAEGELVSFTATASDTDLPADDFWFSLAGNAPAAARITRAGTFTWIPGEAHGPGTHTFDIVVTDKGTPARSSTRPVTVTVSEVNLPPRLTMDDNYLVEDGLPFVLVASADDPDLPAQDLRFTATGLPDGAELSAAGELTWSPTGDMVGDQHAVTIKVTDSGSPAMSDSGIITLTLIMANRAPVLAPIGDKHLELGGTLAFTARATDEDGPISALRFSLTGAPAGVSIDPVSGALHWHPAESQYDARHTITVTVTDAGRFPKTDSETFDVVVGRENVPPTLTHPGDQLSAPGESAALTVHAVDPDGYPETLAFSASNLPPGLTIDEATGAITGTVGFDGVTGSPFDVEISVSDGRVTTSTSFTWEIAGTASPGAATQKRNAIVSGITDNEPPPVVTVQPTDVGVSRSLAIMSRAARSGATEMSFPLLLLLVMAAGLIAFGRIGVAPVFSRGTRHEGVVRRYDPDAGSGLVTRASDGVDVFVHTSAVARRDRATLAVGDNVVFRTIDGAYRDLITKLHRPR